MASKTESGLLGRYTPGEREREGEINEKLAGKGRAD